MAQRVGSFGYVLSIPLAGVETVTGRDFRVVFRRPDQTQFERSGGDVQVVDEGDLIIGAAIKDGDFTMEGTYQYQVIDETGGNSVRSDVERFYIAPSLED